MTTAALPTPTRLGRGLLLLMSVATGLSVAGNYFAQPVLDVIGRELQLGTATTGLIVTAAQLGYALGLILLVPLGDVVERRSLTVALFGATSAMLLVTASATSGAMLFAGTVATAVTSVAAQVLVPFAVSLARPEERGRVVATVMSGVLLGGLLARPLSGALSEVSGWRAIYWANALLVMVVAVLLWRFLPALETRAGLSYPALLRTTVTLLRTEPTLRWRAGIGALSLATFAVFWTSVTFLLAGPAFRFSEAAIGLFGLIGITGVIATPVAGRLVDRGRVQALTGVGTAGLTVTWLAIAAGGRSLAWLLAGVTLLTVAQQALLNANQSVIYALRPEIRNRVNSAFMTAFFVGGAAGSALSTAAWTTGGWSRVSALGAALALVTFGLWVLERLRVARTGAEMQRNACGTYGLSCDY